MEIKEAIETLEEIYPSKKQIVTGEYPDVAEALDAAISALRKQQEREKGCEMCKGRDALLLRKAHKYCHYCGRPLKEAQEDGK